LDDLFGADVDSETESKNKFEETGAQHQDEKSPSQIVPTNNENKTFALQSRNDNFVQDFKKNLYRPRGEYIRGIYQKMDASHNYMSENTEYV
jgi:hypothetical protein